MGIAIKGLFKLGLDSGTNLSMTEIYEKNYDAYSGFLFGIHIKGPDPAAIGHRQ
jgi:hypothetical protein